MRMGQDELVGFTRGTDARGWFSVVTDDAWGRTASSLTGPDMATDSVRHELPCGPGGLPCCPRERKRQIVCVPV